MTNEDDYKPPYVLTDRRGAGSGIGRGAVVAVAPGEPDSFDLWVGGD